MKTLILFALIWLTCGSCAAQDIDIDNVPNPKCKPWETIVLSSHSVSADDWRQVVERKWCELDSNKAFPFGDQLVRHFIKEGPTPFIANFWDVKYTEYGYTAGDCYLGFAKVRITNTHHFKYYRDHYDYRITESAGSCGTDHPIYRVEIRYAEEPK